MAKTLLNSFAFNHVLVRTVSLDDNKKNSPICSFKRMIDLFLFESYVVTHAFNVVQTTTWDR
jgi:hypothetical protein